MFKLTFSIIVCIFYAIVASASIAITVGAIYVLSKVNHG